MELSSGVIAIAAALAIGLAALGVAIGQGITAKSSFEAMSRQPELFGNIRSTLILAMGLLEALAIYALLIALILVSKI